MLSNSNTMNTVNNTYGSYNSNFGYGMNNRGYGFGSSFGGFNSFNTGFNSFGNGYNYMNAPQGFTKPSFFVAFDNGMLVVRNMMDAFSKFSFMIGSTIETINGLVNTFLHDKYSVTADSNKYRGGTFFIKNK